MSPESALALYAVITYMDSIEGVWWPEGGMDAVPAALATAAARAGADLRFGTAVSRLVTDRRGAVAGVELESGESIAADAVVCTLGSCHPWPILGIPPAWYKSSAYRSRMVREPRRLLAEMGLPLDPSVEIRVWDSVSEIRYLVLPMRPAGTEGWSEEQLAGLVTRDSMIGTGFPKTPGAPS